jgi:ariadne-1
LIGLSFDEALALLLHCKWDKERLVDSYFQDSDKLRAGIGLPLDNSNKKAEEGKRDGVELSCLICYDKHVSYAKSFALSCQHRFCNDCYAQYLQVQLSEGPSCLLAMCPQHKCRMLITRSVMQRFFLPPSSSSAASFPADAMFSSKMERYDDYLLKHYINTSKSMRHCPAPSCSLVALGNGVSTIHCSCGQLYCFKCGEDAHEPCSCSQLSEWQAKCANESETANWILANTRKCPACQTRIEKNQGCNHMSCRICKHEFCWICMGSWVDHGSSTGGFYKCNRFAAAEADGAVSEAQRAKAELDRYLHYYQRYHGHDQALSFARTQLQGLDKRLGDCPPVQLQTPTLLTDKHKPAAAATAAGAGMVSYVDMQYIKQAAEQVLHCRQVLKYTYVLGYYLKDDSAEKQLYEHQQEMLEKNTERLQEYTDKLLQQQDKQQLLSAAMIEQRVAVINLTRVTERFMCSLLANMTGGIVRVDEAYMIGANSPAAGGAASERVGGAGSSGERSTRHSA